MRLLVLTSVYPTKRSPWAGSFVRARLRALSQAGVQVECRAVVPVRSPVMRQLTRLGGGDPRGYGACRIEPFVPVLVPMRSFEAVRLANGRCSQTLVRRAARHVAEQVDLHDYDHVLAHGMYGIPAGAVAQELLRDESYTVVCHGSDVNVLMQKNRALYVRSLDGAKRVIFVSEALRRRAHEMGMNSTNSCVIPNGVDLDIFRPELRGPCRRNLGIGSEEPVVAFVGNLQPVKGADRLPRIAEVLAEVQPQAHLLVAGDGPLRRFLETRLHGNSRLLGRLSTEEVAAVLAAADVAVLPSRSEGWPTVIQEAHACGTPVVGAGVGGIPEALSVTGTVVPEGPAMERRMAVAVADSLESRGAENDLRESAALLSWDSIVRRELEVMQS
jgi:teichuronic acid biosynthesis glycosyltransferase TuaC